MSKEILKTETLLPVSRHVLEDRGMNPAVPRLGVAQTTGATPHITYYDNIVAFIAVIVFSAALLFKFKKRVDTMTPRHRTAFLLIITGIITAFIGFFLKEFDIIYSSTSKVFFHTALFLAIAGIILFLNIPKRLYDWCLFGKNEQK